jgi:hypothetical protein
MNWEPKFCKVMLKGFKERKIEKFAFSGVPHPIGDKDFTFPEWKIVDAKKHIHIIEKMMFFGSYQKYDTSPVMEEFRRDFSFTGEIPKKMWEDIVDPLKEELRRRLGEITLEKAQFDINLDGKKNDIYRINPIYAVKIGQTKEGVKFNYPNYHPKKIKFSKLFIRKKNRSSCEDIDLPGQSYSHSIYFDPKIAPHIFSSIMLFGGGRGTNGLEFFFWKKHPYLVNVYKNGAGDSYDRINIRSDGRVFSSWISCIFMMQQNKKGDSK